VELPKPAGAFRHEIGENIMTKREHIAKFWALAAAGKSAALDINAETGELALLCTRSTSGAEGNGTPPACWSSSWTRIISSEKGVISQGAEN
jgi:hypothetical protein